LQDGTPVKLRLGTTVTSSTANVGDSIDLEVLEQVNVGSTVVIQKGATAMATVTDAHSKKSMGRAGKVDINIDYVRLADGEKAALRAVKDVKGGGHQGAMTGAMVATSLVFFPAAPLFLFMHGKDISIPKGTEITAFVSGDMPIALARFQPGAATEVSIIGGTASATTELDITSKPDGAEISVDGNFVGNTPSNITVTSAQHTISVRQAGYHLWERTINTSGGKVTLTATLATTDASATAQPAIYESESRGGCPSSESETRSAGGADCCTTELSIDGSEAAIAGLETAAVQVFGREVSDDNAFGGLEEPQNATPSGNNDFCLVGPTISVDATQTRRSPTSGFHHTPIKNLLSEEMNDGLWCDPFAGQHSPAQVRNDLNPEANAEFHMDALDFLKSQPTAHYDGVLYDPPYSSRQASECYANYGRQHLTGTVTNKKYWAQCKDEIARILKPGGKALCFGWNSMGICKSRGFEMTRVLMVPHGGSRNDTVCTVEIKIKPEQRVVRFRAAV